MRVQVFSGHSGSVNCGKFSPDGKTVVTGSQDGSLRVWNPKTAEATITLQGHSAQGHPFHTEGLVSLAISNDSQAVLSGSEDGGVFISNIVNGRVLGSMQGRLVSRHMQAGRHLKGGAAMLTHVLPCPAQVMKTLWSQWTSVGSCPFAPLAQWTIQPASGTLPLQVRG